MLDGSIIGQHLLDGNIIGQHLLNEKIFFFIKVFSWLVLRSSGASGVAQSPPALPFGGVFAA